MRVFQDDNRRAVHYYMGKEIVEYRCPHAVKTGKRRSHRASFRSDFLNQREELFMEKKPGWDDIPSLGLQLEKDELKTKTDNRSEVRLPCRDLLDLLMVDSGAIAVQVTASHGKPAKEGLLVDINQKGMGLLLESHDLKKNDSILIGAVLGQRRFTTNAVIRWTGEDKIGVEYINPRPEDYNFLSELYGAKILNNL